jgi:hypothetical protein
MKGNRYGEAYTVLEHLRETPLQAARDLYNLHCQIQVETILFSRNQDVSIQLDNWDRNANRLFQKEFDQTNFFGRLAQLFTIARNRRASVAACMVMASQQLSGVNIFAFLADTLLSNAQFYKTTTIVSFNTTNTQSSNTTSTQPSSTTSTQPSNIKTLWISFGFSIANAMFVFLMYHRVNNIGF